MQTSRTKWALLAIIGGAGPIVAFVLLTLFQSRWFQNRLREHMIAAIENATGAAVQLGSLTFDWRSQTIDLYDLFVRGSEPDRRQPVLRAESVRIRYRIDSFLRRKLELRDLEVRRPEIHLSLLPDSSIDFPWRHRLGHEISELNSQELHVWDGSISVGFRRVPFSFDGRDVSAVARYDARQRAYLIKASVGKFEAVPFPALNGKVDLEAAVEPQRIAIHSVHYASERSTVQISGAISNFVNPAFQFQVEGRVPARELDLPVLRAGELAVHGSGVVHGIRDWAFTGTVKASDLDLDAHRASGTADLHADQNAVAFKALELKALGSTFVGTGNLSAYRDLRIDGTVHGLNLRTAGVLLAKRDLPWSGSASGPIAIRAEVEHGSIRNAIAEGRIAIEPSTGGIPIRGTLDAQYRQRENELAVNDAEIDLPHSHLSFAGMLGRQLRGSINSSDLADFASVLPASRFPVLQPRGSVHFDGTLSGLVENPRVSGNFQLTRFSWARQSFDQLRSQIEASAQNVRLSSLLLDAGAAHASGSGDVQLANWSPPPNAKLTLEMRFTGVELAKWLLPRFPKSLNGLRGAASGSLHVTGELNNPQGRGQLEVVQLEAFGEKVTNLQAQAALSGNELHITSGQVRDGRAALAFSGVYQHANNDWTRGTAQIKADSNEFPISVIEIVHRYNPELEAATELHAQMAAAVRPGHVDLTEADGSLMLRRISIEKSPFGDVALSGRTDGQLLHTNISGDLRTTRLEGQADIRLIEGNPGQGTVEFGQVSLATLRSIFRQNQPSFLPLEGSFEGKLSFDGPLEELPKVHLRAQLENVRVEARTRAADLALQNSTPVSIDGFDGIATIQQFKLKGRQTDLDVSGTIPYLGQQKQVRAAVKGSVDLTLLEAFDPNVQSSGHAEVAIEFGGTWPNLKANGKLAVANGAIASAGLPSELTAISGTITFNQSRASIEKLTAQTGGGRVSVGGFLNYGGGPLTYSLTADTEDVRVRHASGISVTSSSELRLTGTSERSILSGTTTISRVILNPNTDVGNLLTSLAAFAASPTDQKDFLRGMQFDVTIESAPTLQLSTAFSSEVRAQIDLRLRGSLSSPALLGSIFVNAGDVKVFGTRYSINRGEVIFVNAARIEPVLDLDVQTQLRGIVVDITVTGTLGRLNVNYRSDPPLQPRDIIALLTIGRTPEIASSLPTAELRNDVTSLQTSANTLLGQVFSPSSNRLSKLFGVTNVKIDPLAQGIVNAPQARLTLEQQVSKQIAVTYVTNLSQTSEQIFRFEWAFNPNYSLVAIRDDNGEFGIDIQYRKRFK